MPHPLKADRLPLVPFWYQIVVLFRYPKRGSPVPALNIEFTDEELAIVRAAASSSESSMRAFAKQAILDKASDREGRIRALAEEIATRSAELNRRLA